MSDPVLDARTGAEILEALAGAICDDGEVPTPAALAEWLHGGCPEAAFVEATARLDAMTVTDADWAWTVRRPLPGFSAPDETPEVIVTDGYYIATAGNLHARWLGMPEAERPRHPLAPIVAAWQARPVEAEPYRPVNRAVLPDLSRRTRDLPDLPTLRTDRGTLWLPGLEPAADACPSWLLALWDRAGGQQLQQGGGAPWALRIWIGALLHVAVRDRTGRPVTLPFTVREIAAWLHPDGWTNRRRDWAKLPAALRALGDLRVPLPIVGPDGRETTGMVALVAAPVVPADWRNGNAPVYLDVRVPPEGAAGSRLDWPTLTRYGTKYAALYRAYLAVTAWMHRTAYRGAPITRQIAAPELRRDGTPKRRKGGGIVRQSGPGAALVPHPNVGMVPTMTDANAARLLGFDPADRFRRRDARRALERLATDGVIDLETLAVGTFRIYGPGRE